MLSNLLKVLFSFTALSPTLLMLYFIKLSNTNTHLKLYIETRSIQHFARAILSLLSMHYLLISFIGFIFFVRWVINLASKRSAIGRVVVKSLKPGDMNFGNIIFSTIPAIIKLYNPEISDTKFLFMFLLLGVMFGLIMKSSYHYNFIAKLLLGYNHYEIQTKDETTYILLAKGTLINKSEITDVAVLADHMLVQIKR